MAIVESRGNSKMTLDEVYALADSVLEENYPNELIKDFSSKKFATPIVNFQSDEELRNYVNSLKISEVQKDNIIKLSDILFQYTGDNLCDIILKTKDFENVLIKKYEQKEIFGILG